MDAGGEGRAIGKWREEAGGRIGAGGFGGCGLLARSKNAANFPRSACHLAQSSADVKRQYFMLLKNSTSMI